MARMFEDKLKKVFYLLLLSLLLTLTGCGDSQNQIDESGYLNPCNPELFQETSEKTPNTELKAESE